MEIGVDKGLALMAVSFLCILIVLINLIGVAMTNRKSAALAMFMAAILAIVLAWAGLGIIGYYSSKDGKDGKQGPQGERGEAGKDGVPGKDGLPGKDGVCKKCEHQKPPTNKVAKVAVEPKTAPKSTTTSVAAPNKTGPVEVKQPQSNEPPDPPEVDTTGGEKGAVETAPSRTRGFQSDEGPGDPPKHYDEGERPLRHPPLHPVQPAPQKRDKNGRPNGMFGDYRSRPGEGGFWGRQQRRF